MGLLSRVLHYNDKLFHKQKKQHKVSVGTLKKEIKRRALKFKFSNKTMDDFLTFLQENENKLYEKDQSFLEREVATYKAACDARTNNEQGNANVASTEKGPNITYEDWFRAIEALLSDAAKAMMIQSQECLTRPELDARNSAVAVVDYFQVASDMFNLSTFIPHTTPMPDLHPSLADSIPLPLKEYRMTRAKMKEKYDSLKKRLHLMVVKCVVA